MVIEYLLPLVGGAIVVGGTMVAGYQVELWLQREAPRLGIPNGAMVIVGLLIGVWTIMEWFR